MTARLKELQREKRKLRKQCSREQAKKEKAVRFVFDVAFTLYCWTCPTTALCEAYLAQQAALRQEPIPITTRELEDHFIATDTDTLRQLLDRTPALGKAVHSTALRFESEFALATWIRSENEQKGLAPTTDLIIRHLRSVPCATHLDTQVAGRASSHGRSTKWVQRFRTKWNMQRSRMPARDPVPVPELQAKVPLYARVAVFPPSLQEFCKCCALR